VREVATAVSFCTDCGHRLTLGDSFCPRCGARVTGQRFPPLGSVPPGLPAPQGASPVVTIVVVVVVALSAAAILGGYGYGVLLGRGFCHCPGSIPIGSAFVPGDPTVGQCLPLGTFVVTGCQGPNDFFYRVSIIDSTINFGAAWFFVETAAGAVEAIPSGLGFTVLTEKGMVAAQYAVAGGSMGMSSDWTYASGVSDSTPVNTTDYIVIDMGTQNPRGLGLEFLAQGMGSYTGTTNSLGLP